MSTSLVTYAVLAHECLLWPRAKAIATEQTQLLLEQVSLSGVGKEPGPWDALRIEEIARTWSSNSVMYDINTNNTNWHIALCKACRE